MNELTETLEKRKRVMIEYIKLRVDLADWHGVMDASVDIRELESQLSILKKIGEADAGDTAREKSCDVSAVRDTKTISAENP